MEIALAVIKEGYENWYRKTNPGFACLFEDNEIVLARINNDLETACVKKGSLMVSKMPLSLITFKFMATFEENE